MTNDKWMAHLLKDRLPGLALHKQNLLIKTIVPDNPSNAQRQKNHHVWYMFASA
jgi:hypothetical protein